MKTKTTAIPAITLLLSSLPLLTSVIRLSAADNSAADQVRAYPLFAERIDWLGSHEPPPAESADLLRAMQAFGTRGAAALDDFLAAHPQSAWTPSLRVNLADFYARQGRYSPALAHYEAAWPATRGCSDPKGQNLAARNAAGLAALLAGLGQKEQLDRLLREIAQSQVPLGAYSASVAAARDRLQTMQLRPGDAFKCGLIALINLAKALHAETTLQRYLLHTASPEGGFTLAQLLTLGQTNGLGLAAVRRPSGADLVVPCVVHWKFNHYAVIAAAQEGRYQIVDSTKDRSVRMTAAAIDAESSGVFLLPRDMVPSGWPELTPAECADIRGGCYGGPPDDADDDNPDCEGGDEGSCSDPCDPPSANDGASGDGDNPCPPDEGPGMPRWQVSEPYINLWLHDTPLRYRLASGRWMPLKLSYKQRSDAELTVSSDRFAGFGPNWSCNWLGLMNKDVSGLWRNRMAGGGVRAFQPGAPDYKSGRILGFEFRAGAVQSPAGGGFYDSVGLYPVIQSPLGAKSHYTVAYQTWGDTSYFLTRRTDRYGRSILYSYVPYGDRVRLSTVYDVDGRTNSLAYTDSRFPNLITSITDPYDQTCHFTYDSVGRLATIVDMIGLVTTFQYDQNNLITNMTTPYGVTGFRSYAGPGRSRSDGGGYSANRALLVSEPDGSHQLYAFCGEGPWDYCGGDAEAEFRNSYHWNRAQYAAIPTADLANLLNLPNADYFLASIQHWLHADATMGAVCDTVGSLAGPVDPLLPGYQQRSGIRSFWYQGQTGANFPGTLKRVTTIWDASWQPYFDITRNDLGRPVVLTYYNSDGTSAAYTNHYDPSGMYLREQYGPRGERVRGYGYANVAHPNLLTSVTNALDEVTRYTHDPTTLRLTSITFPSGLVRTNVYYPDGLSQGFLQMQADLGFRTNYFTYTNGNVLIHTNELGLVITNTWDDLNRLVGTAYPDGTTASNLYDKLDVVGVTDRLNQWTRYTFDPVRQLRTITNANQQITLIDYCGCGAPSSINRWSGTHWVPTAFQYDIAGRLTNTIYGDGYQVNRTYDENGFLQFLSDSGGRKVSLDYAYHGLRLQLAHACMVSAQSGPELLLAQQFDEYGRLTNSIDRNAVATFSEYDLLDRITRRQVYGNSGQLESGKEGFVYDARGLTNYLDPSGQITTFVRDAAGRELFLTNANLEILQFTYDAAANLLRLTDGKNQATSWKYDCYGQVTNKLDANNADMFRYQYDADGRLSYRWQAGNVVTTYGYDAVGNLTSVVYPTDTGLNCIFQYDGLNRLTNMLDAVATNAFTWSDGDQLLSEAGPWPASQTTYAYNNRLPASLSLAQSNAGPWTQTYLYDEFGRLTNVTSAAASFGYRYEQPSSSSGPTASDLVQRLSPLPVGGFSERAYDDLGRLLYSMLVSPLALVPDYHGYAYDLGSQRTQQVFRAANYVNYFYDNIGQLRSAKGFEPNQTPRPHEQFGYGYDAAWNLNSRTNNQLVQTFSVNNLNELTGASRSGTLTVAGASSLPAASVTVNSQAAQVYADNTFAQAGNSLADGINTFNADAYDAHGGHASASVSVNLPLNVTYTYDARGNLLSDGLRTFDYDDENQLKRVTVAGAWKSEFEHDGLLRRRARREYTRSGGSWVQTNEVHYLYDRRLVVQERDANNVPQVTYTRGNDLSGDLQGAGGIGGLLARSDRGLLAVGDPAGHAYYHADGNGNITCLVAQDGSVVAQYAYDPFGNILAMSGTLASANLYRFSSKEYHPNSGLVYYLYRYYDPNLQRWLNRDPIGERRGLNLFTFVDNGPTLAVDTDGLSLWNNTIRVCKQSGKLIKQIRERNFERAIQMTKESLRDLERHGEHHPVVHVPGDPAARDRTARALSDTGGLKGPEQHGDYPPHVHPVDGPFSHTHVQDIHPHFPWGGALGGFFVGVFAPTAAEGADSGDTGYFLLGAAWDALTWLDPVGITDLMECTCK